MADSRYRTVSIVATLAGVSFDVSLNQSVKPDEEVVSMVYLPSAQDAHSIRFGQFVVLIDTQPMSGWSIWKKLTAFLGRGE